MLDALVEKNDRVLAVFCKISSLSSSSPHLIHNSAARIRSLSYPHLTPLPCIIPLVAVYLPPSPLCKLHSLVLCAYL